MNDEEFLEKMEEAADLALERSHMAESVTIPADLFRQHNVYILKLIEMARKALPLN